MVALTGIVLVSLCLGCAQTKTQVQPPHLSSQAAKEWSAEEHREAADLLDEEAVRLEAKVAHLEQRVERFNKKPYLDPKEIKRQEWRALIRANRAEISELREQIIWHYEEAERLSTMPPSEESGKLGEGKRS